eukprot:6889468-Pyramimonas_sp.AAC.2
MRWNTHLGRSVACSVIRLGGTTLNPKPPRWTVYGHDQEIRASSPGGYESLERATTYTRDALFHLCSGRSKK